MKKADRADFVFRLVFDILILLVLAYGICTFAGYLILKQKHLVASPFLAYGLFWALGIIRIILFFVLRKRLNLRPKKWELGMPFAVMPASLLMFILGILAAFIGDKIFFIPGVEWLPIVALLITPMIILPIYFTYYASSVFRSLHVRCFGKRKSVVRYKRFILVW